MTELTLWTRVKAAAAGLLGPFGLASKVHSVTWSQPPTMGTEDLLSGYDSMPWLRAPAEKVGMEVASIDYGLEAVKGTRGKYIRERSIQRSGLELRTKALTTLRRQKKVDRIDDHAFLDALNANPFFGRVGLLKITNIHVDLVGEAFWLFDRNALGTIVAFWPVPPHWVLSKPTPNAPFFRVSYRSWQAQIPISEMHVFNEPAPVDPYARGSGIGWTIGDELEVDEYAAKMAKALFFNQARPDFIVYGLEDKVEKARVERDWLSRLQGWQRMNRPIFMTGEPKFHEFQRPTMEQLVYPGLRKIQRDVVLQTWGISPEMFGITENSNRAVAETAQWIFRSTVVKPRAERMRENLQTIAELYDERIVVTYPSPVPQDKRFILDVVRAAPVITRDEWRALAEHEPMGDERGDEIPGPVSTSTPGSGNDSEKKPEKKTGIGGGPVKLSLTAPPERE
jgi:hypothetical protein